MVGGADADWLIRDYRNFILVGVGGVAPDPLGMR